MGSSSSRSTSTIGGRLGGSTPPPAPVPTFLYWQPQGNQWLMSPTLGGSVTEAEMAAKPTTSGLCPADVTQVWQTKEARTRSGRTVSWTEDPSVKTECKPDLMVPVPLVPETKICKRIIRISSVDIRESGGFR